MALKAKKIGRPIKGLKSKSVNGEDKSEKKAKTAVIYEIGNVVKFVDYNEPPENPLFEEGDKLVVVDLEDRDGTQVLTCVKESDHEAYEADPDSVDGMEIHPTEVKPIRKGGALMKVEEPVEVLDVGDMGKLLKSGDTIEKAKELYEEANKNFFYFGGLLAHIFYEKKYVKDYTGSDGWDKFCAENFGFQGRKGRYYIDIYMQFSKLPKFDVKKLSEIGWSKSAEISRFVTEGNVEDLIEAASDKNIVDLKEHLKEEYVTEGGKTPSGRSGSRAGAAKIKRVTFTYKLYEDMAAGVTEVLAQAKKQTGLSDENALFEHIIMEWAAEKLDEDQIARVEKSKRRKQKELKRAGIKIPKSGEEEEGEEAAA